MVNDIPAMVLNDAGTMIEIQWQKLSNRFPNIQLHDYVIMPNHFHGIIQIIPVGAALVAAQNNSQNNIVPAQNNISVTGQPQGHAPADIPNNIMSKTIGDMMGAFKSITTVEYTHGVKNYGWQPFNGKLWQRNYYEHIIRNEQSCQTISNYIVNNPVTWTTDKFYK